MRKILPALAFSAALLAACGTGGEDLACTPKDLGELSPRDAAHVEAACNADISGGLHIAFLPDPESDKPTCEYLIVAAAPLDHPTPRLGLNFTVNETTQSSAGYAVTDRFFEDRLSASYPMDDPFDRGGPCAETSIEVTGATCRVSAEAGEPNQDCGPITYSGGAFFAAFTTPEPSETE